MINRLIWIGVTFFVTFASYAQATNIVVTDAYIRETIPGTKVSSAYMVIKNNSDEAIKLVGAMSSVTDRIEIHEHVMTDEMMRMQQVASVSIDANSEVVFQPMGHHLMIFNLPKRLKQGETYPITLQFSQHSDIPIDFPVKSIKKMHHHH